jgi:hypothetical protein
LVISLPALVSGPISVQKTLTPNFVPATTVAGKYVSLFLMCLGFSGESGLLEI